MASHSSSHGASTLANEHIRLDALGPRVTRLAGIVGGLGLLVSAVLAFMGEGASKQFFFSYLVAFLFFLALALGGLFLVTMFHLTGTRWGIVVRRVAELIAANVGLMGLLSLVIIVPVLLGNHELFIWTDPAAMATDHLMHKKAPYLNVPFFLGRCIVYFGVWIGLSQYYLRHSVKQDETGDPTHSAKTKYLSGPGMILFGITTTLASIDFLMSLSPNWFSTIFGVYFFASCVILIYSALTLIMRWLQRHGRLTHSVSTEHYHDLGKMMFAFVFFWAYIGFSQFMLIWYADIPEETVWFVPRMQTSWSWWSLLLLFGHFLLPFPALLSRHVKRSPFWLQFWAVYLFVMVWVDLFWLVMPVLSPGGFHFHILDVTCMVGVGGLFVAALAHRASKVNLIPIKDPFLPDSLSFENPY